jgi:hypothetical protein
MRQLITAIVALLMVCSQRTSAQATSEVMVGPVNYQQNVNGVLVNMASRAFLSVVTVDNDISLKVRIAADFSDLQNKFGAIVDSFALPKDNCGSYGPKNFVVSLPSKEIDLSGASPVLRIRGSVVEWECAKNPIPNSKIEWQMKEYGPKWARVKTKVPVPHTWPGDPIKTILVTQPFEAALPFQISKRDDHSVGLTLSRPDIELQGQYAFITKGILHVAGVNINEKGYDALQKAIDPQKLVLTLPSEVARYNPVIEEAHLYSNAGHLSAEIRMSAHVTGQNMTELISVIMKVSK